MAKVHNYAGVPAKVTLVNNSEMDMNIQLFRTNLCYALPVGDSLILNVDNSAELIYFENMANTVEGLTVSVETVQ